MSIGVKVKNGNLEKALSIFRRKVKDSKLMVEYKDHQYYTKPSKEKRDAKHKAKMRQEAEAREAFAWDPTSKYYDPKPNR